MKVIRGKDLQFVPASHEDQADPGVLKKVLFKREDLTPGRIQMINWATVPAGKGFKAHFQEDMEEIFIIIEGKAWVRVDDQEDTLEHGDALVVAPREIHQMKALQNKPVVYVCFGVTLGDGSGKAIVVS